MTTSIKREIASIRRDHVFGLLDEELHRAQAKHPAMVTAHHGYAVILEELDELWLEIKAQDQEWALMQKEAIQVAASAIRFVLDLAPKG